MPSFPVTTAAFGETATRTGRWWPGRLLAPVFAPRTVIDFATQAFPVFRENRPFRSPELTSGQALELTHSCECIARISPNVRDPESRRTDRDVPPWSHAPTPAFASQHRPRRRVANPRAFQNAGHSDYCGNARKWAVPARPNPLYRVIRWLSVDEGRPHDHALTASSLLFAISCWSGNQVSLDVAHETAGHAMAFASRVASDEGRLRTSN